jgi:hypothetical protein
MATAAEYSRFCRDKRYLAGLCIACGGGLPTGEKWRHVTCVACRRISVARSTVRRVELKMNGRCIDCRKPVKNDEFIRCVSCRRRNALRQQRYRKPKRGRT